MVNKKVLVLVFGNIDHEKWFTVPSSPPMDIRCTSPTSQSIQVSWQPPPNEDCNGNIQGYKLTYEPVLDEHARGTFSHVALHFCSVHLNH